VQLAVLLIAAAYSLPDAPVLPEPDAGQKTRIAQALEMVRRGDPDKADIAVRELALVGEAALPAIVARLNRARAGERLLLLAAVRRMARGAPLLSQAKSDESAAIRAWASGAPAREEPDLRLLAARYLDLLAVAEEKKRVDADKDLAKLKPRVGRPTETLKRLRERMRDRRLSGQVQYERSLAAARFARVGGSALRDGSLKPSLGDPVFMAYLALLREETGSAGFFAVPSLVAVGAPLAAVLEPLLDREHHDPRKILRILFAVREDKGRGLYDSFDRRLPKAQRALVHLAPHVMDGAALVGFFEQAARAKDGSVRGAALDELLAFGGPVALETAQALLDTRFTMNEFRRAARLLARADVVEPLAEYAAVEVPKDNAPNSDRLRQLQRACISVLRSYRGKHASALAERFLKAGSPRLRILGFDMMRDGKRLMELAYAATEARIAGTLARRAIELGDEATARAAVAFLRRNDQRLPLSALHSLRDRGFVRLLVGIAAGENENEARNALSQLAQLEAIDKRYEEPLLAIHRRAPNRSTLEALLPLGTPAVQQELGKADREDALRAVAGRAESADSLKLSMPLLDLLKGADAGRLTDLQRAASVLPDVEPGFFYALFLAWDSIPPSASGKGPDRSRGAAVEQVDVLAALARSRDKQSAKLLLDALLQEKFKQPPMVLGTLRAAARLLGPGELIPILPKLAGLVAAEHPNARKEPPGYDAHRFALLRGGFHALGYAQVEEALPKLCDFLLDPMLQPAAFDYRATSAVPGLVLLTLRLYPSNMVDTAFRAALKRAEQDGRLARFAPAFLFGLVRGGRERRVDGRGLAELRLALCEVLERLPWKGDEYYEKMRAFGAFRRYADAAGAARIFAADQRARGYRSEDGLWTPRFVEGRALLYDALVSKEKRKFDRALPAIAHDPFLLNLAGWYVHFHVKDATDLAQRAATRAVRDSAGLFRPYRDTLAAVRVRQNRPDEALRLLDNRHLLPGERAATSGWYLYFQAQAQLLKNNERAARRDLEQALNQDRRLIQYAKADPVFSKWTKLFRLVEDDFLDHLFAWG